MIEVIIAMLLASIIFTSILNLYLSCVQSLQIQTAIKQILHQAQSASYILQNNIKTAGYIGCAKLNKDFQVTSYLTYALTLNNKLMGNDAEIVIRRASPLIVTVKNNDRSILYLSKEVNFKRGDVLLISDCNHAEIFVVKDIFLAFDFQKITPIQPLKYEYASSVQVSRFEIKKFYVEETHHKDLNGKKIYALYKKDLIKNRKTQLVEGIGQLQFSYSIMQYGQLLDKPAHEITDWSQVIAVAIKLSIDSDTFKKNWYLYVPLEGAYDS